MIQPGATRLRQRHATLGVAVETLCRPGPDGLLTSLAEGAVAWLIEMTGRYVLWLYPVDARTRFDIIGLREVLAAAIARHLADEGHPDEASATKSLLGRLQLVPHRPFCDVVVEPHSIRPYHGWPDLALLSGVQQRQDEPRSALKASALPLAGPSR